MEKFEINDDGVLVKYNGSDRVVAVPDGVIRIEDKAFCRNDEIVSVILPKGLKSIGTCAFALCYSLRSVIIPDSIISIDIAAFFACRNLTYLDLYSDAVKIGQKAFLECDGLADDSGFVIVDGYLFKHPENTKKLVVPEGVRYIDSSGMSSSLTSVTLPKSMSEISPFSFHRCEKLKDIYVPRTVTKIDENAFRYCENLTVHAPVFSYAHKFARAKGIPFKKAPSALTRKAISTVERVTADIEEARIARSEKEQAERLEKYRIKKVLIDEAHAILTTEAKLPAKYRGGYYCRHVVNEDPFNRDIFKIIDELYDPNIESNGMIILGIEGEGMSFLLNMLYASFKEIFPDKNVRIADAHTYVDDILSDLQENKTERAVDKMKAVDILLLDDCFSIEDMPMCKKVFDVLTHIMHENGGICIMTGQFLDIALAEVVADSIQCRSILLNAPDDVLLYRWGADYAAGKGIAVSAAELKEMASKVKYIPQLRSLIDEMEKNKNAYN